MRREVAHAKMGEVQPPQVEIDLALVGDVKGVGEGLGVVGELPRHLLRGLQISLPAAAADGVPLVSAGEGLDAGEHVVELVYRPTSWPWGLAGTICGLAIVAACVGLVAAILWLQEPN